MLKKCTFTMGVNIKRIIVKVELTLLHCNFSYFSSDFKIVEKKVE